ncbi:MAG TPA: discoidin domain-containing protein [Panacibacter sp.]|nr:discoidin domain-containing protein [Panacibacter sp.]
MRLYVPMLRLVFFVLFFTSTYCFAQKSVVMQHNDLDRTGWNSQEFSLNQSNVRPGSFGKLYSRPAEGFMYAQPLVVSHVNIPGKGFRNVLYVATTNNKVYAYDADSASVTVPYWTVNVTPQNSRLVTAYDLAQCKHGNDFGGNIGIVGTPAIDTAASTMYFVSRNYDTVNFKFEQYLHAMDIATGAERANSPKLITATVHGGGIGNVDSTISFDPLRQNQRPGLLLLDNRVYICWGSHCDWEPYHGWVMAYDQTSLEQQIVYNITREGEGGGIWMCGGSPSVDASGNIYITSGDGSAGTPGDPLNAANRSLSFVKLKPVPSQNTLEVLDYFTPRNYLYLDSIDADMDTQVMLIPGSSNRAIASGKDGVVTVLNTDDMGKYHSDTNMVLQSFLIPSNRSLHTTFAYYKAQNNGYAYLWGGNSQLHAFPFNYTTNQFDFNATLTSYALCCNNIYGASMSISSNGSIDSTAVLWVSHIQSGIYPPGPPYPGILRAFAANDITKELWNSNITDYDTVGRHAKYVCPTVINGRVYEATYNNQVVVYGLTGGEPNTCSNVNVALNKPAFASTFTGTNYASNVTDGKATVSSRWLSQPGNPQYIYVDLGAQYSICKVALTWSSNKVQDFKIQVSDDAVNWTDVSSIKKNSYKTNNFLVSGTGRYVRMYGTKAIGSKGYSLLEFEVYGTPISIPTYVKSDMPAARQILQSK